ncbi:MAG: hypothetical protein RLZZ165_119, partial [Bacteroidota bacterium]
MYMQYLGCQMGRKEVSEEAIESIGLMTGGGGGQA